MRNFKTTLAGVFGAMLQGGAALLQNGSLNWKDYAGMATAVVIGALAKDFNVTGDGK